VGGSGDGGCELDENISSFTYTGLLYTQTEKQNIELRMIDCSVDGSSVLLTGLLPGKIK
jgi:hypothetical protein